MNPPPLRDIPDAQPYTAFYVVLSRYGNVTIVVSTRARAEEEATRVPGARVEQWIVYP